MRGGGRSWEGGGQRVRVCRCTPVQVNDHGRVLLDLFVRPKEKVTNFRTQFSGIRPQDIAEGVPHEEAMRRVHALLDGKTVVGHAVHNDIKVPPARLPPSPPSICRSAHLTDIRAELVRSVGGASVRAVPCVFVSLPHASPIRIDLTHGPHRSANAVR